MILGMDHNMNLLNCMRHKPTNKFLDILLGHNILPLITRPTRITQQSVTLIDNIFVSKQLHRNFDSAVLLSDISDHLPTLALFKQTKILDKEPLELKSQNLTQSKIEQINQKLLKLTALDCNENFNWFHGRTREVMNEIAPLKVFKISARCRFVEP